MVREGEPKECLDNSHLSKLILKGGSLVGNETAETLEDPVWLRLSLGGVKVHLINMKRLRTKKWERGLIEKYFEKDFFKKLLEQPSNKAKLFNLPAARAVSIFPRTAVKLRKDVFGRLELLCSDFGFRCLWHVRCFYPQSHLHGFLLVAQILFYAPKSSDLFGSTKLPSVQQTSSDRCGISEAFLSCD